MGEKEGRGKEVGDGGEERGSRMWEMRERGERGRVWEIGERRGRGLKWEMGECGCGSRVGEG